MLQDNMSDDSDRSNDSDGEDLLESIFKKFSSDGIMKCKNFGKLLDKLSTQLHFKIKGESDKALFYFISGGDGLSFDSFKNWWKQKDKFHLLKGDKNDLLLKAWDLFSRYELKGFIDVDTFVELMRDLQIGATEDHFDLLDINADGKIDFREFCKWLEWF